MNYEMRGKWNLYTIAPRIGTAIVIVGPTNAIYYLVPWGEYQGSSLMIIQH